MSFLRLLLQSPLYFGIFTTDYLQSQNTLHGIIFDGIREIYHDYPEIQCTHIYVLLEMSIDLVNGDVYKYVSTFHVTTYFMGKDKNYQQYQNQFQAGSPQNLTVHGVAFLPGRIIACIMKREDFDVEIQNRYPHMTVMTGSWQPVDSNVLMESLFDGPLREIYQSIFEEGKSKIYKTTISAKGEDNLPAYVYKLGKKVTLSGITKVIYK